MLSRAGGGGWLLPAGAWPLPESPSSDLQLQFQAATFVRRIPASLRTALPQPPAARRANVCFHFYLFFIFSSGPPPKFHSPTTWS